MSRASPARTTGPMTNIWTTKSKRKTLRLRSSDQKRVNFLIMVCPECRVSSDQ